MQSCETRLSCVSEVCKTRMLPWQKYFSTERRISLVNLSTRTLKESASCSRHLKRNHGWARFSTNVTRVIRQVRSRGLSGEKILLLPCNTEQYSPPLVASDPMCLEPYGA